MRGVRRAKGQSTAAMGQRFIFHQIFIASSRYYASIKKLDFIAQVINSAAIDLLRDINAKFLSLSLNTLFN